MINTKPPSTFRVLIAFPGKRTLVGNALTLDDARKLIRDNKQQRRETYGGLLAPDTRKATYQIWQASGWTLVE